MKGVRLAYDVYYPDGDVQQNLPPILLLHGMMDSRKTWKTLAPAIATETGRIVYAYDARNHGESEWNNDFNFEILALDLEQFMEDMKIPKAVLVGHSMGGRTSLTLALRQPQRVDKLIVEDMSTRNWRLRPRGPSNTFSQMLSFLRESLNSIPVGTNFDDAQKLVVEFMSSLLLPDKESKGQNAFDASTIPLKKEEDGSYSWQANLDVVEDVLTNLDKLKQTLSGVYMGDALFIYGPKSPFRVDRDMDIERFFPCSMKIPIPHAGHMLHTEYPEQFLKHVITFISRSQPRTLQSKY